MLEWSSMVKVCDHCRVMDTSGNTLQKNQRAKAKAWFEELEPHYQAMSNSHIFLNQGPLKTIEVCKSERES